MNSGMHFMVCLPILLILDYQEQVFIGILWNCQVRCLKTGVMKNQAYTLSDGQHRALAAYISEVGDVSSTVVKGLCADEVDEDLSVKPKKKRGRPRKTDINVAQERTEDTKVPATKVATAASHAGAEATTAGRSKRKREEAVEAKPDAKTKKKAKLAAAEPEDVVDSKPAPKKKGRKKRTNQSAAEEESGPPAKKLGSDDAESTDANEQEERNNPRGRRNRRRPDRFITSKHMTR